MARATSEILQDLNAVAADLLQLDGDTPKLEALLVDKEAELAELQQTDRRNFVRIAELEGQRLALVSILDQHRTEVREVRERVGVLTAERDRAKVLDGISETADAIWGTRAELDVALLAFTPEFLSAVDQVAGLWERWAGLRTTWMDAAGSLGAMPQTLFGTPEAKERYTALLTELEARGTNVAALRLSRGFGWEFISDTLDLWPGVVEGEMPYAAPVELQLRAALVRLVVEAIGWRARQQHLVEQGGVA